MDIKILLLILILTAIAVYLIKIGANIDKPANCIYVLKEGSNSNDEEGNWRCILKKSKRQIFFLSKKDKLKYQEFCVGDSLIWQYYENEKWITAKIPT